jgi:hypothetical protein
LKKKWQFIFGCLAVSKTAVSKLTHPAGVPVWVKKIAAHFAAPLPLL